MKYLVSLFVFVNVLLFASCENSNSSSKSTLQEENINEVFLKKGKEVASATFGALSENLQKAMKEGGVSNAVEYCNLAASPIVDSLSQYYNAEIRRTSLKIRNPKNNPTTQELKQLETFAKHDQNGYPLKAIVKAIDPQTIAFYAPIRIMPICQKCHGEIGNTLLAGDYETIQKLYPEDKAIGYASGDLRGMWSILFKK